MSRYWPMTEAPDGTRPGPQLDRETARALVDAGYMPLADYVTPYGSEAATRPEAGKVKCAIERRLTPRHRRLMHPRSLRRLTARKRRAG